MPILLLKLLGIGRWLKQSLSALFRAIRRYPREAAIVALCAASLWLWRGWNGERADHKETARQWKAAALAWQHASDANKAAAIAQVKAVEAKSSTLAKENAIEERALRAELGARAAANAERMRADKYCRRLAAAPAEDNPAPVDPGPGPDAVILERRDYDILTGNTARLKAVYVWGQDALRDGTGKVPEGWPEPAF